jgi:hypothetical protein
VGADVKLDEAGEAAEGQGRYPPDLAAVDVEGLQVGQVPEVVCSQDGLVEEDVGTLDTESPVKQIN